jgi:photosystem II stability/assembly factor-like uncharacterized protein
MCISLVTIPFCESFISSKNYKPKPTMRAAFNRHIRTVFVVVLILLPIARATSQWSVITRFTSEVHSGYFFNEMVGFVGCDNETQISLIGTKNTPIYKTTNGGKTWIETTVPTLTPLQSGGRCSITEFFFTDTLNGWASTEHATTRLLRTSDGGLTWSIVAGMQGGVGVGDGTSVYQTPSALIVTTRRQNASGVVSTNNGSTFLNSLPDSTNDTDFIDDQYGVATGYEDSARTMRTTDGGVNWQLVTPRLREESWSVFANKLTRIFYIIPEGDPSTRTGGSPVYRSTSLGDMWQQIATLPFRSTGQICGFGLNILYVQVEENHTPNGLYTGLWRSDDAGFTWHSVGGPKHDRDRRFAVTGCKGGIVYAFDRTGNLWKTRNGGDGSIIEPDPAPLFSGLPINFNSRICEMQSAAIRIRNEYCADLVIKDVVFINPSSPIVTSGALSITSVSSLPKVVGENTTDSVTFNWDPGKFFDRDTTVSVQVRITYFNKAIGTIFDTVITINAKAIGDSPTALVTPPSLAFGQVSFCQPHDSLFTFTNTGCDTLTIVSSNGSAPVRYLITDEFGNSIVYPIYLPPGASFKYKLSLYLDIAGSYSSTITFKLQHQGKLRDTTIAISASVSTVGSFDAPTIIDIGKVSICSNLDSLINLRNLGCDTLRLSNASLKFNTDFSIISFSSPEDISPDSSSKLKIRLQPKALGLLSDTLILTFTTLDQPMTIKVVLRGEGTTGEAYFIMTPTVDTLFALSITRCDPPQIFPITISNPGCNKLNLREVTITGAPIENVSRTLTATLPIDISNNQNVIASIQVSPTTLGSFSGMIYIRYQIEGDIERDTILYYSLSVRYGTKLLAIQPDNIDFGVFRLCTTLDTSVTLRNLGCDTLELTSTTITANIDALSPLYMPRVKIPPGDTTSLRVRYAPMGAGSMTGSITFSSTSDSTDPLTTTIQATIIPTDSVQIRLTPVRTPFYVGDTITIQLIPDKDVSQQVGLRSMTFGMNYNGDLLTVITPTALIPGLAIIPGSSTRTLPAKLETQNYLLQGSAVIVMEKDKPFAEFRFIVRLTDTTTTPLFLSNIMLNNNDSVFAKCTLGVITAQTSAELTLLCGDSTLREFMRSGNVIGLRIAPSFPNPITSRTNYKATLPFTSSTKQSVRLVIVDVLGNIVQTMTAEALSGKNSLELDAGRLASGTYHFAISSLSNSSEAVVGRFVVEH